MTSSYLLHSREALELGAAEVLLLQGRRLQHEVLLLGRVHLLQVLGRRAGLPVQGLLDHLQRAGGGGRGRARAAAKPAQHPLSLAAQIRTRPANPTRQGAGETTVCKAPPVPVPALPI